MRSITVCVGYDDLLAITLPSNARRFKHCLVVTHPDDQRTIEVVKRTPNASLLTTDAFYRHGAKFNKGLAMEEAFDALGRKGWISVWDADTLLPGDPLFEKYELDARTLYSAPRITLEDLSVVDPANIHRAWQHGKILKDVVFAGYFHIFHASDPHIAKRPWYDVTFTHAGGGDGYFQSRWQADQKKYLPFYVLHLGPTDANWCGRITPRIDGSPIEGADAHEKDMRAFLGSKGWNRERMVTHTFNEHVDVPDHSPTGFRP